MGLNQGSDYGNEEKSILGNLYREEALAKLSGEEEIQRQFLGPDGGPTVKHNSL